MEYVIGAALCLGGAGVGVFLTCVLVYYKILKNFMW